MATRATQLDCSGLLSLFPECVLRTSHVPGTGLSGFTSCTYIRTTEKVKERKQTKQNKKVLSNGQNCPQMRRGRGSEEPISGSM